MAAEVLADSRTGKNGWHGVVDLLRQSVYGRLAGYEDVNDADRLGRDPAMRWIVGGRAVTGRAASTTQMGRFETQAIGELSLDNPNFISYLEWLVRSPYNHCMAGCNGYFLGSVVQWQ